MVAKILVAYRTRAVPGLPIPNASQFSVASNIRDPAKIAERQAEKLAEYKLISLQQAHTATFDEVVLMSFPRGITAEDGKIKRPEPEQANFAYSPPDGKRLSIAQRVGGWILKHHGKSWSSSFAGPSDGPEPAVFIGFNTRTFLKIMGSECARAGLPLPLRMWFKNTEHYDIEEAARAGADDLTWPVLLTSFGLQAQFSKWPGPGQSAQADMKVIYELAARLGMLAPEA